MKRVVLISFLVVVALLLLPGVAFASTAPVTIDYGDIVLPAGYTDIALPGGWNLNDGPVSISYTQDLSGAPNVAFTGDYNQAGLVGLFGGNSGARMDGFLADWNNPGKLFPSFPDVPGSQDIDDKFNLQRLPNPGSWSETMYDVLFDATGNPVIQTAPFGSGDNYGIWFDRDGVDQWQATYWGMVNGGTYNTEGVYDVRLDFQKVDATHGAAWATFFPTKANTWVPGGTGIPTGFKRLAAGGYQYLPAGLSFASDADKMGSMIVHVSGGSGDGAIVIRDLTVTGYPTLMSEKQAVLDSLPDLKTGNKDADKKIDDAIKHLQNSLDASLWVDGNRLNSTHGNEVFDEEKSAVKKLGEIKDPAVDVTAAIGALVGIDHDLAQAAIDAVMIPGSGDQNVIDKVQKELDKANDEMGRAQDEFLKGHFDNAIDHFKKAWEHAQQAMKHAAKA